MSDRVPRPVAPAGPPVVALTPEQVRGALTALTEDARQRLGAGLRPAVRYATSRLADGQTLPVGASRLGGLPDLPAGAAWPTWTPRGGTAVRPLLFFAQVELATVRAHLDLPLPEEGLLQLWADFDLGGRTGITGLYDDELEGARVTYAPPGVGLQPARPPEDVQVLPEAAVAPLLVWTLRTPDELDDEDDDAYDDAVQQLRQHVADAVPEHFALTGGHQLGGHADQIQGPVEDEAVQAAYGCHRRKGGFDLQRWAEVADRARDWSVLFQFDSDESLDLVFGDLGTLWWVAPTADVAARRWDRARCCWQC